MRVTPAVTPLAREHRSVFFYILLGVFLVVVPLLGFYANGYRYDFLGETPSVTVTGGMYIATQVEDSEIYVNDAPIENTRFFRQATYVQGLMPGKHQVHVQGEGLQTWVKDLPVYEQIVTEVAAFTIPETVQLRPITPYLSNDGEPVFLGYDATTTLPFQFASTTVSITYSSSTATSTWQTNPEYTFLESIFAQRDQPVYPQPEIPRFRFATSAPEGLATTSATSTVVRNDVALVRRGDEVFAVYQGVLRNIPYYYCLPTAIAASTTEQYGAHVTRSLTDAQLASTTLFERGTWFGQTCRSEIRLDRKNQMVAWYDFVPGSSDLVLLQLEDGIYVTEIDDRAWQNHQLLYPTSEDIQIVVNGGQIFLRVDDVFAELYLELQE